MIPNGIDYSSFTPLKNVKRISGQIITTASADVPLKGLDFTLHAVARLKEEYPQLRLVIIGASRSGGHTERLIKRLQIEENISYRSNLTRHEIAVEYAKSNVAIVSSLYEGFGFPLVEMIATGLPVIVSDKASLPELAGDAGLKFNSDDVSDLKDKMKELVKNHALRDKLANNSKIRRDAFFGWDEYAKKLEELFEEIISGNI